MKAKCDWFQKKKAISDKKVQGDLKREDSAVESEKYSSIRFHYQSVGASK